MNEQEGVIKYQLNHQNIPINNDISISDITAWRRLFYKLNLIGQLESRYEGFGFGNISQRITPTNSLENQFLISGTQTGGIEVLSKQHYCLVVEAFPYQNKLYSIGEIKPSSESLTHASIYQHDKNIQSVIHIHSPEIWNNTEQLNLPYTDANIAYGTPEMAKEVDRLLSKPELGKTNIFCMPGHTDGVIAFSDSIEEAANLIIYYYMQSLKETADSPSFMR